jgi:hypothetical protein
MKGNVGWMFGKPVENIKGWITMNTIEVADL